uniref:Endoplasmic reticulum resident protein 29 n=1 Tax=Riptortus pedestris TaxID=329032 RepID=R4WDJ7_RIPPE|nr:endoplasmic reticulum protein erp29 [Riptortus pedestris]
MHYVLLPFIICAFLKYIDCKGCVQLDTYSFDKITSKFEASLIKFDTAYPYGAKHDAFEAVCEAAYSSPDLLVGEVQVKDYGEKDNEELAKRYGVIKDNYPTVKLFTKNGPVTFVTNDDKDFTSDNLKKFIRSKSQVYIGLPGCLEDFDKIATEFIKTKNIDEKKSLLKKAENLWDKAKGNRENKSAETYVKIMRKILEKGPEFITNESVRVENVLKGKINKEKQTEMQERVNILQSFSIHDEL